MRLIVLAVVIGVSLLEFVSALPSEDVLRPHFSDEFARKKVVTLCAATEGDTPQTCLDSSFSNATVLRKVTVRCDNFHDSCSGYVAINHGDKAIMMAFRGTVGKIQLLAESKATILDAKIKWVAGGYVSEYFYNAFMRVWLAGIEDAFLGATIDYTDYELWIVGHSLGGAMASLAASYIGEMKLFDVNRIKLVTFGQPRTGDVDFANAHGKQIPYAFRVTHSRDIVPHVPPRGLENYHHHKSEVFYNNDMTVSKYIECDEDESSKCSDRSWETSIKDHHRYYNVYISRWGNAGCKGDPVNPPRETPP